ncbi:MAG: OpgC domain-containing protein [Chloroflexi bacterium]|nr:OpgC domain-containing protein [Chloroflexota bacterium]
MTSWRYERSTDARGKRDLRIDLLRGFCVFVMIVDHVGGEDSWLYVLTGGNRFFVSAAEGFVLLSGISMGLAHRRVIDGTGVRAMLEKVFGRAWLLYALTVILTITFAAASSALGTPWSVQATPASSGGAFALSVLTFQRSYSLTDVLLLYTLLVLAAAPALWLIARGHTVLVLGSSAALWAAAQVWPRGVPTPWVVVDGGFPFAAWQLLFFGGLVAGFHRQRLEHWLAPRRLIVMGIAVVAALIAAQSIAQGLGLATAVDTHQLLFDKNDARIGRVLALGAAASFAFAFVTLAWTPLRRSTGWLFLRFGHHALFAYAVQLFVVAFWSSDLMAPLRLDRENALFQAAAAGMVWLACVGWSAAQRSWRSIFPIRAGGDRRIRLAGAFPAVALVAVVFGASASDLGEGLLPTGIGGPTISGRLASSHVVRALDGGRLEEGSFYSQRLRRTMPFAVYVPPGYDDDPTARYPVLYMLHGGSGTNSEWLDYGLIDAAEALMSSGEIAPMIIVLPQGDQEYWIDHVVDAATGSNGAKWGSYLALEVVPQIDVRYRTITSSAGRAIGGLSMGGHAAMELPMNFPAIWSVIGAHSPALRPVGDAPTYLGSGADFAARDPLSLIAAKPTLAATYEWWIDAGDADPWLAQAAAIHAALDALGIASVLRVAPGDHSLSYWSTNAADYLRYYAGALCARVSCGLIARRG